MAVSERTKGVMAIVASAFGFALMAACVRLTDDFGPPVSCVQKSFFRNFVALSIAVCVLWHSGSDVRCPRTAAGWRILILRSLLGTCGIFANFYALGRIPIAEAQTLNKTAPFFTVIFTWLFLREKATGRQMLALVASFFGVLCVVKPGFSGAAAFPLAIGVLGGLCAGAMGYLLFAQLPDALSVLGFVTIVCAACCLRSRR